MSIQDELNYKKDYVIQSYKDGKSMTVLGKEFRCNSGTICFFLKKMGVETRKRCDTWGTLPNYIEEIKKWLEEGKSAYWISKQINVKVSSICKFIKKNKLTNNNKITYNPNNLLKDKENQIIELFNQGKNSHEISKIIGHSNGAVFRFMQKIGLETTQNSEYKVNEEYFDIIDDQKKAYIIGWFYSDGCVDNGGKFRISLKEDDGYILEWMRQELGYEGPLHTNILHKRFNSKPQTELCINRKRMADKLIGLGVLPNKSLILTWPTTEQIPADLQRHFLRGFFDGDGSCYGDLRLGLTSTKEFLNSINEFLGVTCKMYQRRPEKNSYSNYFSTRDFSKIYHTLYDDSTIHLHRKHDLIHSYLQSRNLI